MTNVNQAIYAATNEDWRLNKRCFRMLSKERCINAVHWTSFDGEDFDCAGQDEKSSTMIDGLVYPELFRRFVD